MGKLKIELPPQYQFPTSVRLLNCSEENFFELIVNQKSGGITLVPINKSEPKKPHTNKKEQQLSN